MEILDGLSQRPPVSPLVWAELGEASLALGQPQAAVDALCRAAEGRPEAQRTRRTLAAALEELGEKAAADHERAQLITTPADHPVLMEAAEALRADDFAAAERLARAGIASQPDDKAALWLLGEVMLRLGRLEDAESSLDRCLELHPSFEAARHAQALTLFRQGKTAAATGHLQQLLAASPHEPAYLRLLALSRARPRDTTRTPCPTPPAP